MGKAKLYRFRRQQLFQRKYKNTFFLGPAHHPNNHRKNFTDTQEEAQTIPKNHAPY